MQWSRGAIPGTNTCVIPATSSRKSRSARPSGALLRSPLPHHSPSRTQRDTRGRARVRRIIRADTSAISLRVRSLRQQLAGDPVDQRSTRFAAQLSHKSAHHLATIAGTTRADASLAAGGSQTRQRRRVRCHEHVTLKKKDRRPHPVHNAELVTSTRKRRPVV